MTPVFDAPDAVRAFVSGGIFSTGRVFGPSTAIGFANEREGLVAGFVYHNYEPDSGLIEVSGYSSRRDWVNRDLLKVIFNYPFNELGCRAVVARHSERNTRVIRIWRALGAKQTPVPDLRDEGVAEVISILKAADWRESKFAR